MKKEYVSEKTGNAISLTPPFLSRFIHEENSRNYTQLDFSMRKYKPNSNYITKSITKKSCKVTTHCKAKTILKGVKKNEENRKVISVFLHFPSLLSSWVHSMRHNQLYLTARYVAKPVRTQWDDEKKKQCSHYLLSLNQ